MNEIEIFVGDAAIEQLSSLLAAARDTPGYRRGG